MAATKGLVASRAEGAAVGQGRLFLGPFAYASCCAAQQFARLRAQPTARTMISGAHAILYSRDPEADRAFLRDVLALPHVDVGGGWLIFGLPPAEVAVHPSDDDDVHELYFLCDDVAAFVVAMTERGITCDPVHALDWGFLTNVRLPGGGKIGVYEPRHARPAPAPVKSRARKPAAAKGGKKKRARKPATKATSTKKAAPKKAAKQKVALKKKPRRPA
jgi:catechol 2,3-dioxygenase-like lactoylglutathione lyase family enzyme